jgi:hypothetical protein
MSSTGISDNTMTRSMIIFVLVQQREYDDNVKLQMGTVVGDV